MGSLTRFITSAAALILTVSATTVLATGAASGAPPSTTGATVVALRQVFRSCDFTMLSSVVGTGNGAATALVRAAGSTATAEVRLIYGEPDTHYDVGLIQAPRPSSATCGPGDPGTAFGSINTDGGGAGTVTVQDGIRPGTTGVWVTIERRNERSQTPAEFYTSDFIAPV